jgi:hypothetical protein
MKRLLRILAFLVAVIGFGVWLWCGQNQGWTKTSKAIERVDPVTEIVFQEYQKGFFPGVDFLAITTLLALGLFGSSFLVRKKV